MGKPLATWIMAALALSPTRKKGYVAQGCTGSTKRPTNVEFPNLKIGG